MNATVRPHDAAPLAAVAARLDGRVAVIPPLRRATALPAAGGCGDAVAAG